jgi:hypothetical protein
MRAPATRTSYHVVAASLLISGLITLAVGAEEVRTVAAGLSPHP